MIAKTDRCIACDLPFDAGEVGIRKIGINQAHSEQRCVELLLDEVSHLSRLVTYYYETHGAIPLDVDLNKYRAKE